MPARAYADTHPQVRQEILTRVAAGELPTHVCAEPGMPSYGSLYAWARKDPAFAADWALARSQGAWRRRLMFDPVRAEALLKRLRAGEPITAILRDPAMPSRRVYAHWRATQAPFQEEVHRLNSLKAGERAGRLGRRWRDFDQDVADLIVARVSRGGGLERALVADPRLPCRGVVTRWRREQAGFADALRVAQRVGARKDRALGRRTPELTEAIVLALCQGESLASLGLRADMPCRTTLYAWVRTQPDFAAEVAWACEHRQDWYVDQVRATAQETGDVAHRGPAVMALKHRLSRLQYRPGSRRRG